jgi:hypothetical protein
VLDADPHLTLVFGIALPFQITHDLELLQDRRERIGFEKQLLAQTADGLVVFLPKRNDRDVLGVSEPMLLEYRLVYLAKRKVRGVDRKAQVVGEHYMCGYQLIRGFHLHPLWLEPDASQGHTKRHISQYDERLFRIVEVLRRRLS